MNHTSFHPGGFYSLKRTGLRFDTAANTLESEDPATHLREPSDPDDLFLVI